MTASRQRPLRLIVTNDSRMWGGTEHYAVRIAAGLRRRGCDVRMLWGDEIVGARAREAGLPGTRLHLRADADLPALHRLAGELRAHRADVLLATRWREFLLGGLAARLARTPRVVLSLGLRVVPKNDLKRRLIFGLANRVIVNAGEIREALLQRSWVDPAKVFVVHNGIELARYGDLDGDGGFRSGLGVPPDAPLIVTVGALTPQKDHAVLARAAARLAETRPDVHVAVVGEGFLRPEIEALSDELDLGGRFHLAGFRADVRPALAAADLFVLSSHNEGMPWVLLEALAAGLPLVATDVSGTRACVDEGVNGRVVPPRDPDALAAACLTMLDDPARLAAMGEASRAVAAERFDEERMIDETLNILTNGMTRWKTCIS